LLTTTTQATTTKVDAALRENELLLVQQALHLTRNRDEAMDLVQDTFERALRHPEPLTKGMPDAGRWLHRVLFNLFVDRWRQRQTSTVMDVDIDEVPNEEAEEPKPWLDITAVQLQATVDELPEPTRSLFLQHYFRGVGYEELGRRFDVPLGTIASRLLRARRRLRHMLQRAHAAP
jgi:RNA polymerase sigma-70 factor, ECF subfamily